MDIGKLIPGNGKPEIGSLLISEPFMQDSYFKRTVVLLTAHDDNGSVGYILNKPLDVKLNELLGQLDAVDFPVYLGGPVQKDNIFYLHNLGELLAGSIQVCDGLFWGGDFDTLKELLKRGEVKESNIRFYVGYSGWSEGQLEEEINLKSWIVTSGKSDYVLSDNPEVLWKKAVKDMGQEYVPMANYPENPSLN